MNILFRIMQSRNCLLLLKTVKLQGIKSLSVSEGYNMDNEVFKMTPLRSLRANLGLRFSLFLYFFVLV